MINFKFFYPGKVSPFGPDGNVRKSGSHCVNEFSVLLEVVIPANSRFNYNVGLAYAFVGGYINLGYFEQYFINWYNVRDGFDYSLQGIFSLAIAEAYEFHDKGHLVTSLKIIYEIINLSTNKKVIDNVYA